MAAMEAMKNELLTAIHHDSEAHADTHQTMRDVGEIRHRRIDDFLGNEAISDARRTGAMTVGVYLVRAARLIGEFRWLIAVLVVLLSLILDGGASINLNVH